MNHVEYKMCASMVKWSDDFFWIRHPDLLIWQYDKNNKPTKQVSPLVHVTNEGKMSAKHGAQTNAIGRRKGFPDFLYPVPRHGFGGLYIEVKRPGEKTRNRNQIVWGAFLRQFNRYEVVDSVSQFQRVVEEYMG